MSDEANESLPTRHSLLARLKDWEDQTSWREFFDAYWRLIYAVARKAGLSDAEAQDVVQETVLTVAKKIADFKARPEGSFKGWLLQITRRRIADQFEKRRKTGVPPCPDASPAAADTLPRGCPTADTARTATVERVADPASLDLDACWEAQWQQNLLETATERVKQQVSPKQYQMFDLYVLREWPVRKVAQTLGVSATQVYLAKHRVGSLLKKEMKRLRSEDR
jgi:RNA polymerase sigma-70 factor (ECF subfamily)